jgi:hypothetical protein
MSWEEELRQLDDALAAGKVSASKHRKRRDEILAEASSAQSSALPASGVLSRAAWRPVRQARRPVAAPSLPQPSQPITPTQAQEMFVTSRPATGRRWLGVLAAVLVLALAAGVTWWFGFRQDEPGTPAAGSTSSAQPRQGGGIDELRLPGTADDRNGKFSVQRALELKVLSPLEADLLKQSGITEVTYVGASEGDYRYLVYAYPSVDPDAARATTGVVAHIHEQIGLTEAPIVVPDGVQAVELRNAKAAVVRALYTSGNTTVQLAVLQEPAGDPAALESAFKRAVALAVDKLPPS